MFGLGQFLLFHQDGDQLRQRGDLLVLHADDRQQLEYREEEEDRHADQREGVVLDPEHAVGHPRDALGPEGQADERKADQQEEQRVAFLEPIRAQSSNGQEE